ncbi:MAG: GNAT family N-acetyltransferase [Proteobacteria bacterium]|nr:GNAT family N-acetyltransferase [Pseudomonadota bacterium]
MSHGRYSLRRAARGDAAGIAEVHRLAREAGYDGIAPEATLADHIARTGADYWRVRLPELLLAGDDVVVAEAGGRIVGFMHRTGGRLDRLYVIPAWWGSGLAQALFLLAREAATAAGHDRLTLDCHRDNARARRFYARLGGTETGEREDRFADGTSCTVVDVVWRL